MTVSNLHATEVRWGCVAVDLPADDPANALTDSVEAGEGAAEFGFVKARNNLLAASPSFRRNTLPASGSFTLMLEDISISSLQGGWLA
ncbi:hypothetical protein OEIGOIKO_00208 [Streptomyces chrestomyceticus JCM 4735]|uniref:Uncharacterized protein n=1 Tax=Streptomyces chrestomyceticus JCM 4735 TaxID=1306181 RepID=A0A7U9KNH1_9ACTN|nr:hypothetical protein OEIGOIKO_00208 [Streptomyces chrestomyceticus JCM 4735]